MEAQTIFLYPFTVCSSCTRKFGVCPSFYEETNGSYPFANGLNGLAHLCRQVADIRSAVFWPGTPNCRSTRD